MIVLLFAHAALAGPDVWLGAGVTSGVGYDTVNGVAPLLSQAEVNLQADWEEVVVRVDLDVHVYPDDPLAPLPLPVPPEAAYVQLGTSAGPYAQVGVVTQNIAIEMWDERDNYMVTYSTGWGASNSQLIGAIPGFRFEDGTEVFLAGGYDLGWFAPSIGAGVATEQDVFSTWSGAFLLPTYGGAFAFYSANEVYPLDALWLTLQLEGGHAGEGVFWGGPLFIASLFPEAVVGGAVRAEAILFGASEAEALLEVPMPPLALSAAVHVWPTDWLYIAGEGKLTMTGGASIPSVALLVDLHVPELE